MIDRMIEPGGSPAVFPALASARSGPLPPPSSLVRSFVAPSLLSPGAGARASAPALPVTGTLFITGTGTGVGKTIVTAAIAARARAAGQRVAVVKLAQTGVHNGPGSDQPDLETVTRLAGVTDTHELARFPDPLSPEAAARVSGLPPVDLDAAAEYIAKLADSCDLVLVEGAGGLLVRYDRAGATIADLIAGLRAPAVVVTTPVLGTLNHTALTLEALAARKIVSAGVVIGSWPARPGLAELANQADLEVVAGGPLAGLLPAGASALDRRAFLAVATAGLIPSLGGTRGRR
jgi:dethiobiotin synthetase